MDNALTHLLNVKLLEKFNGNASELARVVGTSQQNISNWLNGDVIKPAYWKKAARALDISEKELMSVMQYVRSETPNMPAEAWARDTGFRLQARRDDDEYYEGPEPPLDAPYRPRLPPNATLAPRQPIVTTNKMLPVLGMAIGGEDGRYVFNGSIIDYVVCPPSLENVAGAYAVYIDGESMYPRFKPGETAWVHPGKPARRGDDVIVQIHPPEDDGSPPWGYVKELKGWAGNKLVLTQHNPQIDIEFDRPEVMTIHPIVLSGKY
ncbi:S24 family peptidase [Agrobacterium sp. lyk4-40-TYG-31]|uniref:LexA family transcriptional regulator n=1 Tax=Agrobacterium sp. lyk4-40-TYG-31 TaxID=3040276 RepID=UPI00254CCD40|nr:S24 family peptidase [Agrobacterium sp. lyk4-40-TYG-31]